MGQAVEEEDEVNFVVRLAKVKMGSKADAVLRVPGRGSALAGAGLGVEQAQRLPAHLQAIAQQQPQRCVGQFAAQGFEHLSARIGAVVGGQLFQCIRLRGIQKGPQRIFGNAVLGVGNVGLRQQAIAMHPDKEVCNVLLKLQLRCLCHDQPSRL